MDRHMRKVGLIVVLLGAWCGVATGSADITSWTAPALTKVFPDDPPGTSQAIRLQACRNEVEWGQIVLRGAEAVPVRFSASDLRSASGSVIPAGQIAFHPAVYVRVSLSSGNRERRPEWPEVLPLSDNITLQPNRNQPVYVKVVVPEDAPPGLYEATITCSAGIEIPLRLRVWPLTIPRTPTTRTSYYVWWDGIETRFGLKDKPELRRRVFDCFFAFMLDHRLCPMSLPVDIKEAERYMRDPRVNGVRLPYCDDDKLLADTIAFVKRKDWLERCYYYLYDEPPWRLWPEVWAAANRLTGFDPLTPRLDTIQPEPDLQGAVSIWCPNVESVYLYDDRVAQARARGEQVWWYTCVFPKAPYPTFLLDDAAIAPRLLFWAQPRHDLQGSLYINTIHWGPEGHDPWAEAAVDRVLLGNNDGLVMYTGRGKTLADAYPVTGLRLEMIRDGLEDIELCHLLRDEIARRAGPEAARRHLAALASQIVPDLRHADREPRHLLRLREQIAAEIMSLQSSPASLDELLKLAMRSVPNPDERVAEDKFAVALPGTPVIDGKLDDAVWVKSCAANAPGTRTSITRFRNLTGRIWPSQGTQVNCLYDDGSLYFAFQCQEPEIAKLRPLTETGDLAQADRVAVALSVKGQERWFVVTMEGVQLEGSPGSPHPVRSGAWEAKTHCEPNGYTVEMRLPRSLAEGALINLFRYAAPGQETLYFSGRHSSKRNPFQFGTLELR
jgi:hypothetical protein